MNFLIAFLNLFIIHLVYAADPFPIQFSISDTKITNVADHKDTDFAFLIPAQEKTYKYFDEDVYRKDYQRSYFAITCKKGGWDCMRHYEILANGCVPYFLNLQDCNPRTMEFLPRKLILEAMNLPGVPQISVNDPREIQASSLKINHDMFDKKRYFEIVNELLVYTKQRLTTKKMAEYILSQVSYKGGKILFLSGRTDPDYMRECTLTGLKELLGTKIIDAPKIDFLYKSYTGDVKKLYGKGFSYTKVIEDLPVTRENIVQRINNKEFELIIYGSVHRGLPFHELVKKNYHSSKIVYICGEDAHKCQYSQWHNLFLREFDALMP